MPTEAEMMQDLAAADAAGDKQLAQRIVTHIKAQRGDPVARAYESGQKPGGGNFWDKGAAVLNAFNHGAGLADLPNLGWAAVDAANDAIAGRSGPNSGFGSDLAQERAKQAGVTDQFQARHPVVSNLAKGTGLAAQVGGMAALGGMTAAPAAASAGRVGLGRMIAGGLTRGGAVSAPAAEAAAPLAQRLATIGARNATAGGAVAALNAAAQPGTAQQKLSAAGDAIPSGAALGAALPAVIGGLARGANAVISPNPATQAGRLAAEGIPLTPGQAMGGVWKTAEDKATSLPITGDAIIGARNRGRDAFNRAVANRALAPIGETLPANVAAGNDAVSHVSDRLGNAYTNAEGLVSNLAPDPQFHAELAQHAAGLSDMPQATQDQFSNIVNARVLDPLTNGSGSGAQVGGIQSQLRKIARTYQASGGADGMLGESLQGVSDSLSGLASRQNPAYADAKSAADEGWANFVRMRQAAASSGAKSGVFTPAQLKAAVKSTDTSVGKGATARGDSLMYDLANNADQVMGSTYPDSGTAGRLMLGGVLGGGSMAAHTEVPVLAGLTSAAAPYFAMGRGAAGAFEGADPAVSLGNVIANIAAERAARLVAAGGAAKPLALGASAAAGAQYPNQ